jgi:hypothetical protein
MADFCLLSTARGGKRGKVKSGLGAGGLGVDRRSWAGLGMLRFTWRTE